MVRLETELALERRLHGALNTALSGEEHAAKLGVDEELAVEDRRRRVEGRARNRRVDVVLSSNRVRNQEPDDLELIETASIEEARQDLVDGVCTPCKQKLSANDSMHSRKGSGTRLSGAA